MTATVTTFMASGDGSRMSAFDVDGMRVTVTPDCGGENNEAAFELACRLSRHKEVVDQLESALRSLAEDRDDWKARVRAQDKPPAKLLGVGYVRFLDGAIWLLNRRDRGFGEFGVRVDSWDELFRHYDCRVTEHGEDDHGQWWAVESTAWSES